LDAILQGQAMNAGGRDASAARAERGALGDRWAFRREIAGIVPDARNGSPTRTAGNIPAGLGNCTRRKSGIGIGSGARAARHPEARRHEIVNVL
jgi:hypothetical protein